MAGPTVDFWQTRFESGNTPWDRGSANPQLEQWLKDGVISPGTTMLVPGCGRGWEVALLAAHGVKASGIDYAPGAIAESRALLQSRELNAELVLADVLRWQPAAPVDAVYEQTCLCALHPDHWRAYADQLRAWIRPGGKLFALFVQSLSEESAQGFIKGPPYHCDIHAMRALFPDQYWEWPAPPYPRLMQPQTSFQELAIVLTRKA